MWVKISEWLNQNNSHVLHLAPSSLWYQALPPPSQVSGTYFLGTLSCPDSYHLPQDRKQSLECLPFSHLPKLFSFHLHLWGLGDLKKMASDGQDRTGQDSQPGSSCHGGSWDEPLRWVRGWKRVSFPARESRGEAPQELGVLAYFPIFRENKDLKHSQLGEYLLKAPRRTQLPITSRHSTE